MSEKKKIKFEIVTSEKTVLKQEILQVTVPTKLGEITILPDHIPLVSILVPGVLEILTLEKDIEIISVSGGFVEVLRDKIVILADTAERAQELNEELINIARKKAEETKREYLNHESYDFSAVAIKLDIELAREKALHKWRKLKNIK